MKTKVEIIKYFSTKLYMFKIQIKTHIVNITY